MMGLKSVIYLSMSRIASHQTLKVAVQAALAAGDIIRKNLFKDKKINAVATHDIKLELDVRCQREIERRLRKGFPDLAILGEEGNLGAAEGESRWVVDPIDGTVNFTYGIPHASVSIALQQRAEKSRSGDPYETVLGVVYDPFREELWTATLEQAAQLNRREIQVSQRSRLADTIISLGFAKHKENLKKMLPSFEQLIHRVRKVRVMGSAVLDLVYVATGRMDAYVESGVRLWDIAAGGYILERAGGEFWRRPLPGYHFYHVIGHNGLIRQKLQRIVATRKQG
jgi:myo-inositol-1(or 4)-monophosphatase